MKYLSGWWPTLWMVILMVGLNVSVRLPQPWLEILFWPCLVGAILMLFRHTLNNVLKDGLP